MKSSEKDMGRRHGKRKAWTKKEMKRKR